jgi:hypothetical protein
VATGVAGVGLATSKIPLGFAIAIFMLGVLLAVVKAIVDYRMLAG